VLILEKLSVEEREGKWEEEEDLVLCSIGQQVVSQEAGQAHHSTTRKSGLRTNGKKKREEKVEEKRGLIRFRTLGHGSGWSWVIGA